MDAHTDAELVTRSRAGNRDAFGELIQRYELPIWRLACTLLDDPFEAEDVIQEAFLHAWLNLDLLSDPARFAAWLRRIVFGVSIDWLRVFRPDLYRLNDEKTEWELAAQPANTESPLARLESVELSQRIWEAVARLPPRYRLPLTLFHLDGLSHSKVAEALGVPVSTVRSLITRARQKLQPLLARDALEWFSRQNLSAVNLSLICTDHSVGFGALTATQLASLADTRLRVTAAQFQTAQAAWSAFTAPDPTAIERFLKTDTSGLPYIAAALRRHLEQFPSVDNGLSRTEHQALSVLRERGPLSDWRLFSSVQATEEQIFMGKSSFDRLMAELSSARHPLVQISDYVAITEAGRNVIEGRADHIELNGIDRWVGGVHLKGDKAAWRWDRAALKVTA